LLARGKLSVVAELLQTASGVPLALRCFDNAGTLDAALADDLATALRDAAAACGRASLALSGGKTPLGMISQLAQRELPWAQLGVTLADDRWLPDTHVDSNAGLLKRHLLQGPAAVAQWAPLVPADANGTPEVGAGETALSTLNWPLDVCVLGMGNDGHTASLFPCAAETIAALDPTCPVRLAVVHPTTAPYARISLTLPAVCAAKKIVLHIVGQQKLDVLRAALAAGHLPIARVLGAVPEHCCVYWSP
jgi:6-phosphogluconolactonase